MSEALSELMDEAVNATVPAATQGEAKAAPADRFAQTLSRLPGDAPVVEVRALALEEFLKTGLPHRRIEAWKYTDLRARLKKIAPQAAAPDDAARARAREALASAGLNSALRLVIVDGYFVPDLSDFSGEGGVRVLALGDVLRDDHNPARQNLLDSAVDDPVIALNAAMATDGVIVSVGNGVKVARPLHIVQIAVQSGTSNFARSFVRIGEDAALRLIDVTIAAGAANYQSFDTAVIWLGDDARLDHLRINRDALDAARVSSLIVTLNEESALNAFNMTVGGGTSRYQAFVRFGGETCSAQIHGAALLAGKQHADTTLVLDHSEPGCESRETYHAVLADEARSVFQGQITVRAEAQKTDARMMTRALLLSDDAEADHKPELEIFADDVQCGHGATTGALDQDLLFYLRARGLPEHEAKSMLIGAFIGDVIEKIADEDLRAAALAASDSWLAGRAQ